MGLEQWLSVLVICCLGAMSPGPSLAVIMGTTVAGGRLAGVLAGIAHALGIGVYALACASGLGLLISQSAWLGSALRWGGVVFLLYLGISLLRSPLTPMAASDEEKEEIGPVQAMRNGFLIAFLNPKIALFFLALFSQFIHPGQSLAWQGLLASTAIVVDGLWYCIVALTLSSPWLLPYLQRHRGHFDRFFGILLLALAAVLTGRALLG